MFLSNKEKNKSFDCSRNTVTSADTWPAFEVTYLSHGIILMGDDRHLSSRCVEKMNVALLGRKIFQKHFWYHSVKLEEPIICFVKLLRPRK